VEASSLALAASLERIEMAGEESMTERPQVTVFEKLIHSPLDAELLPHQMDDAKDS